MITDEGFIIKDNSISVSNVIDQLIAMRPMDEDFPNFDSSRKNDNVYCIEWGMIKQREHERNIYDRMINDLKEI